MADHDHDHPHEHGSELSETQLRVRALETILTEKGYIDPAALDAIVETYETKVGPRNGAPRRRQGLDRSRLQAGAAEGRHRRGRHAGPCQPGRRSPGRRREHAAAPQHDRVHAVLLLSVGNARPAAGLVQVGALPLARGQGSARRAGRLRRRSCAKETEIRVWDSTAETRFLVLPMRPAGTEDWSEERLADLVTRDSMIGTGLALDAGGDRQMNGVHDMGGMDGFGKVEVEQNEPPFHETWEGRVLAMQRAMGYAGAWHIDDGRYAQEILPPRTYLAASYYWRWALGMEKNLLARGLVTEDELKAGHSLRPGKKLPRKLTKDVVDAGMTRNSFFRQQQGPPASSRATACAP